VGVYEILPKPPKKRGKKKKKAHRAHRQMNNFFCSSLEASYKIFVAKFFFSLSMCATA